MGLMDRDYYREKKEEGKLKELLSKLRENPVAAFLLLLILLGIIFTLL